jgi:hypothetical protein
MPKDYSFNGSEGKPIPLADARKWSEAYQEKNPGSTKAHFFGRDIIEKILSEDGCMGVRIYYAIDDSGSKQLLLVGADAEGNNLLPAESGPLGEGNIIADFSFPCPAFCPPGKDF